MKQDIFATLFFIEKKIVLPIFGVFFLIVGIIGLFLPIIPGTAFIILGLTLIGNKRLKKFLNNLFLKYKKQKDI